MARKPAPAWRATRFAKDDKSSDARSPFQRDRDRILYSTAFRRLGGVTQVILAGEGHLFHNRLTHSVKVAQVARRIAEMLFDANRDREDLDPDVVEAAALAHDLGHPPFGHVAETELDRCVKRGGIEDGFEGNPQSFRILTKLALVLEDLDGLNLTRATLNAVLKYPWLRVDDERKWGAFATEREIFEWVRDPTGLKDRERCLEAEIMDWADDITYAVHDVEDFFRSGFIPMDALRRGDTGVLGELISRARARWNRALWGSLADHDLDDAAGATLAIFPLREPYRGTRFHRAAVRDFTSTLIGRYVKATSLERDSLAVEHGARVQVELLKELTKFYVIDAPALRVLKYGQTRVIRELFGAYRKAFRSDEAEVFPPRLQEDVRRAMESGDRELGTRLVADSIASMTEDQAIQVHGRLMGTDFGSVTDPTLL